MIMLVVLMVLGLLSGTAIFVMRSTQMNLQGAGHIQRAMQTDYLSMGTGEAAVATVFEMGSENLLRKLREDREDNSNTAVSMRGLEPDYVATQHDVGRLTPADLALVGAGNAGQLRPNSAFEIVSWVDVNDVFVTQLNRAGERAGDGAPAVQMHIVYTARTRLRHRTNSAITTANNAVVTDTNSLDYGRQAGEVVGAYRFFALQTDYPSGRL